MLKTIGAHSTRIGLNQDLFAIGEALEGILRNRRRVLRVIDRSDTGFNHRNILPAGK